MGKKEGELLKEERSHRSKSRVNWRPHGKQNYGLWTPEEQRLFVKGHQKYGKSWVEIAKFVGTRDDSQVRSHAQKCFLRSKSLKSDILSVDTPKEVLSEPRATRSKASVLPKREEQNYEESSLSLSSRDERSNSVRLANEVKQQTPLQLERSISKSEKKKSSSKKRKNIKKQSKGKKVSTFRTPLKSSKKKSPSPSENKKKSIEKEIQVQKKPDIAPTQTVLRRSRRAIKKKSPEFEQKDHRKKQDTVKEAKGTPLSSHNLSDGKGSQIKGKSSKIRKSPRNCRKNKQKRKRLCQDEEEQMRSIFELHKDRTHTRHMLKITRHTQTEAPCQSSYYLRNIDLRYRNLKQSCPSAFKKYVLQQ